VRAFIPEKWGDTDFSLNSLPPNEVSTAPSSYEHPEMGWDYISLIRG
jgi:hypothetical protein